MAGPDLTDLLNPQMLIWAREASQVDVSAAARAVGKIEEQFLEWESGTKVPTLNQLRTLANVYRRSVGIFFLREVPPTPPRPLDYRRLELSTGHVMSAALANGIREAEAKREAALDIYVQMEEEPPVFDLSLPHDLPHEQVAARISERLGITMRTRRGWTSHYEALAGWKSAIEALGVIVNQISGISVQEMRGCSLALFPLPIILLNGADSPLGRIFTLLHELTHLARAESGLCDLVEDASRRDVADSIETYCNYVAGAILVPATQLQAMPEVSRANTETLWNAEQLQAISRTFWASREAVLRRLLILGKTSQVHYRAMREIFGQEARSQAGFVPYPRKVVLSNGRFLTNLVISAYNSRTITGSELSRILGTKLDHLPKILGVLAERAAA